MTACHIHVTSADEEGNHRVTRLEHGPLIGGYPRHREEHVVHKEHLEALLHRLRTQPSPQSRVKPSPLGHEPYTDMYVVRV